MQSPPYKDLFIYYFNGCIRQNRHLEASQDFIGNWEEEGDSFLFFRRPADETVNLILQGQDELTLVDRYQMAYEDWQGGATGPVEVGRLRIAAPWQLPLSNKTGDEGTILLDPGVVFGTGTHATTYDCLTAIQLAMGRQAVHRVVDLGTGTGLLALAAARLGANQVVAVDLNLLAVRTAWHNVQLNRMQDRILVAQGNAKNFIDLAGDLMVSNIHYAIMRQLVDSPGFLAHKQYVLSGLMRSQAKEIELSLLRCSTILQKWERDGIWFTYWGRNG